MIQQCRAVAVYQEFFSGRCSLDYDTDVLLTITDVLLTITQTFY